MLFLAQTVDSRLGVESSLIRPKRGDDDDDDGRTH